MMSRDEREKMSEKRQEQGEIFNIQNKNLTSCNATLLKLVDVNKVHWSILILTVMKEEGGFEFLPAQLFVPPPLMGSLLPCLLTLYHRPDVLGELPQWPS